MVNVLIKAGMTSILQSYHYSYVTLSRINQFNKTDYINKGISSSVRWRRSNQCVNQSTWL